MKKVNYIIAFFLLCCGACKEDGLTLYEAPNSIYFPGETVSGTYQPIDSLIFSYGYVSDFIQDTLLSIPVAVTGPTAGHDRAYKLEVSPNSTLIEGEEFVFENKPFLIKAYQVRDTVFIRLKRTDALKVARKKLELILVQNEEFALEMNSQLVGTGVNAHAKYFNQFSIMADDIVGPPWFWDLSRNRFASSTISYLGDYSQKKFQLMIGYFNLDIDEVVKEVMPGNSLIPWGYGLQAYLNDMAAKGTPVLEEDGTPMKMGKSVQ